MTDIEFELRGEYIPLDALLKATALASSGGAAKARKFRFFGHPPRPRQIVRQFYGLDRENRRAGGARTGFRQGMAYNHARI